MPIPVDSNLLFRNGSRIDGLPTAIANGQPVVFEQIGTSTAQYEGAIFYQVGASNGAAIGTIGQSAPTTSGTLSTPALAATNGVTSSRRTQIVSAATAGSIIYIRSVATMCWRGNSARVGGFRLVKRIATEILVAGQRGFWGLSDAGATNPTNVDPLTLTTQGKVGIAFNTNTGNWQLVNNITGTAPTVLDLGTSFPINTTDIIELVLAALPNAAGIDYVVTNRTSGASASGTLTTNIPANTTFLADVGWMTNNATAATCSFSNALTRLTTPN